MATEEPIIRDNVNDFSNDEQQHDFDEHGEPTNQSESSSYFETISSQFSENREYSNPYQRTTSVNTNDFYEGLTFESKQAVVNAIKQFHFMHSFNFDVVKNKSDKYVFMCNQYGNGCYWRARVSFSKIRKRWELKKLNGIHTCTNSTISQYHVRLDSSIIAHNIVHLVKTNPGIEIKTLIANMHQRWKQSYSYLPIWFTAAQHFVPSTIVKYETSSSMEEGDDNPPRVILNHVFWAFNPCIKGFKYCKTLVQVDETFLTGKYHGTLLTSIGQDGSRNYFPLAFEIVESETKEAWMGTGLLAALQSERVGWNGPDVSSVYCIRHIASNFNKQFKNIDLKKQVINMEFPQAADWLDQIPKSKWTQAYDEGK
ncbi:hypothetical protein GmHk_14G041944 [Glycine max]|nr:hypothetical protein GmHk_14G041944 [Glycine max]